LKNTPPAKERDIRAIDLYAGIGGWALGLRLAGIEVTDSYEWWGPALITHHKNLASSVHPDDIRRLEPNKVPQVDIVIGSPPCTQFSFSNRGGNGDIEDGLTDIEKFLEVVAAVNPKWWAFENVPRVKEIVEEQLMRGGRLHRFARLSAKAIVVDASEFGLPQKRKRCIIGNIDFDLLLSYREHCKPRTLGSVLQALASGNTITDPVWGLTIPRSELTDHEPEPPLSSEELRMNRDAKLFHPVYNNMAFPDSESAAARTVTAVCTRVSRESIVVNSPENPGAIRRLTTRERASLQGFPVTYQFFGSTVGSRQKMIGNAIPPLLTFYIAQAMLGTVPADLLLPEDGIRRFKRTEERPPVVLPDLPRGSYPTTRQFRAAIPNLRFKSGVRFELVNEFDLQGEVSWRIRFHYGSSKDMRELPLLPRLLVTCKRFIGAAPWRRIQIALDDLIRTAEMNSPSELQAAWSRRSGGLTPYAIVDAAGQAAAAIAPIIAIADTAQVESLVANVFSDYEENDPATAHSHEGYGRKLRINAAAIMTGLIVGAVLNKTFQGKP
jgi:DNA (cytosine-5)-methyltransferase 1